MRKKPIAVQEISSGIAAAGDRGYNRGLGSIAPARTSSPWTTGTICKNTDSCTSSWTILSRPEIAELLKEHLAASFVHSPPESVHALPIEGLRSPDITFWSVWENGELLGCGALKELDPQHGEIKSMRTASAHLRKGVARAVVHHIIAEAKQRGYRRLSLETGSMAAFEPARQLYAACGFSYCEPFGDYVNDPNSVFMTLEL